ncbi:acyl-CoA dehydrogenase family protein [Paracoccus sediminicola]|uniref:acyl-CoA dehydrogenase family protein n=1 Tax=Paracoccus sediminicola TaxID=3017783 RepID=UPI0022F096F4|nr:acyl-CoA dehydrogenase [Paracoccus sediminicola]WBU56162.1 acyl-CoA dehydrogenase [Paracoccus sediminicola]
MDFTPTEDRRMLSDTLRRFLTDSYPFETRNKLAYDPPYHSPEKYTELAELGVIGAFVKEDAGGFGGEGFDITTVFEEIGRALCPEPLLGTLMSVRALADLGKTDMVEKIIAGEIRPAFAVFEPEAGERLDDIRTEASGKKLTGRKSVVYGAEGGDLILVAARLSGNIALYAVRDAEISGYAMMDGAGAGEVLLDNTEAELLSEDCREVIEAALDAGRLALCAEAVGAMDVQQAMTIDYMKQRKQFGRPIAAFQALQHRIVDMAIEIEQARSITILAASHLGGEHRSRFVAMAKNLVGRAAELISEESVQLHGGIGMTWEYPGAHYAKRLVMIDHQLGSAESHLLRLMEAA